MTDLRPHAVLPVTTRETWIDVAKGTAIVLVVLRHTQDALNDSGHGVAAWNLVSDALSSVRMPLFFLVSGLFAARALRSPLRRFGRSKVAHFGWLFALWAALYVAGYAVWAATTGQPEGAAWWAGEAAAKDSTPWYLLALAVFFTLARTARSVPATVQLVASGALSMVCGLGLASSGVWMLDRMGHYLVFFLAGCYGSCMIRAWVARSTWWTAVAFTTAWLTAGAGLAVFAGRGTSIGGVLLPLFALPAALTVLGQVGDRAMLAPLAALGRNTLPVYVLHFGVVVAAGALLGEIVPGAVGAPLLAVLALAVSLGTWRVLRPVGWLWALPGSRQV